MATLVFVHDPRRNMFAALAATFSQHGFFESALVSRVQTFGNIAHVFCSYESRNAPGEAPFARGINSIELAFDGKRWWVASILWDEERPDNPLPKEFATKPGTN